MSAVAATSAMPMAVNFHGLRAICVTRPVILFLLVSKICHWTGARALAGAHRPCQIRIGGFSGEFEGRASEVVALTVDSTTPGVGTATLRLREADAEVAGADGADDRVAVARRLHLDPGAAEMWWPVRVVGGDLRERDRLRVVERAVHPGVRDLHGLQRPAGAPDLAHAVERLGYGEPVARGVVQDVERLRVAVHAPDVLVEAPVAELDAAEDQQAAVERGDRLLVLGVHEVVVVEVVGDGEEVVAALLVLRHEARRCADAVGERRVRVQVAFEERQRLSAPGAERGRRGPAARPTSPRSPARTSR